jgi:predicted DNA-binding transcriptional regulator AlpA
VTDTQKPVVLIDELAEMLETSVTTIKRRIRARAFPIPEVQGIDNKHRWARSEVLAFIERGGVVPTRRGKAA